MRLSLLSRWCVSSPFLFPFLDRFVSPPSGAAAVCSCLLRPPIGCIVRTSGVVFAAMGCGCGGCWAVGVEGIGSL